MRGGPSTGLPTQPSQGDVNQARWGTHGDHSIIALTASTHRGIFEATVRAFNLAETYRTPVILLIDELLGHMRERLDLPSAEEIPLVERLRTSVPKGVDYHPYLPREDGRLPMSDFGGDHRYNVTGLHHDMWGFPTTDPGAVHDLMHHLNDKIDQRAGELASYRSFGLDDADVLLISYGSAARSARALVEERRIGGYRIGILELETLWPFPKQLIREVCRDREAVIVVEMNTGQIHAQVRNAVSDPGRVYLANRIDGQFIRPRDINQVMRIVEGAGV